MALSARRSTRDAGAALIVPQPRPQQALDVSAIRAAAQELQEHVRQKQQLQRSDSALLQHAIGGDGGGSGAQLLVAGSSLRSESPRSPAPVQRAGGSGSMANLAASAASNDGLRSPGVPYWSLASHDAGTLITGFVCSSDLQVSCQAVDAECS